MPWWNILVDATLSCISGGQGQPQLDRGTGFACTFSELVASPSYIRNSNQFLMFETFGQKASRFCHVSVSQTRWINSVYLLFYISVWQYLGKLEHECLLIPRCVTMRKSWDEKVTWREQPEVTNGNLIVFYGMSVSVCLSYVSNYSVTYTKLKSWNVLYAISPTILKCST